MDRQLIGEFAPIILEYAKALAWPGVVLIAFAVFGRTVKQTIERINKAKVGDVEVSLSELATKLTHKARGIEPKLKVGLLRRFWGGIREMFFSDFVGPPLAPEAAGNMQGSAGASPHVRPEKDEGSPPGGPASADQSKPSGSQFGAHTSKAEEVPGRSTAKHEVDFAALGEIVSSWAELEGLVFDLHTRLFAGGGGSRHPYRRPSSVSFAVDDFYREKMITREDHDTFKQAQTFRNIIVHAPGDMRFGTYSEFLNTITSLKTAVLSWDARLR